MPRITIYDATYAAERILLNLNKFKKKNKESIQADVSFEYDHKTKQFITVIRGMCGIFKKVRGKLDLHTYVFSIMVHDGGWVLEKWERDI